AGHVALDVLTLGTRRLPALVGRLRHARAAANGNGAPARSDGIVPAPAAPARADGLVKPERGGAVSSRCFTNRPTFASVLSIIITLGGSIALFRLPIAQYPEITPPTVEVSAIYPGANAQVVADTVAAPIEQQVNGVENMMYMSSQ